MKPETLQKIYTCLACIIAIQVLFVSAFVVDNLVSIGSLIATSIIVFNNPQAKISQPSTIFFSYFMMGFLGVGYHYFFSCDPFCQMCLVLVASVIMVCSPLNHPPALAFLFLLVKEQNNFLYDFLVGMAQVLLLLVIAGIFINFVLKIKYPTNGEDR